MATRVFGLTFHCIRSIATHAPTVKSLIPPKSDSRVKVTVAALGKQLVNKETVCDLDSKQIMSFEKYRVTRIGSLEEYKKTMQSLLDPANGPPLNSHQHIKDVVEDTAKLEKSYNIFCRSSYASYKIRMSGNNPALAL